MLLVDFELELLVVVVVVVLEVVVLDELVRVEEVCVEVEDDEWEIVVVVVDEVDKLVTLTLFSIGTHSVLKAAYPQAIQPTLCCIMYWISEEPIDSQFGYCIFNSSVIKGIPHSFCHLTKLLIPF